MPSKRRVTITPLVVEGSIEARILDVLEETGVFLRSEIFDESDWIETSEAISEAINLARSGNCNSIACFSSSAREIDMLDLIFFSTGFAYHTRNTQNRRLRGVFPVSLCVLRDLCG